MLYASKWCKWTEEETILFKYLIPHLLGRSTDIHGVVFILKIDKNTNSFLFNPQRGITPSFLTMNSTPQFTALGIVREGAKHAA